MSVARDVESLRERFNVAGGEAWATVMLVDWEESCGVEGDD